MSVRREAKLTIGWRVEQDEIPDFDGRWGSEWEELEELAQKASELLGRYVWQGELCEEEDSWCGDTQIVGVPAYDRELPIDEWVERHERLGELAGDVYRQVMREEPKDGPYLISWTQVS